LSQQSIQIFCSLYSKGVILRADGMIISFHQHLRCCLTPSLISRKLLVQRLHWRRRRSFHYRAAKIYGTQNSCMVLSVPPLIH